VASGGKRLYLIDGKLRELTEEEMATYLQNKGIRVIQDEYEAHLYMLVLCEKKVARPVSPDWEVAMQNVLEALCKTFNIKQADLRLAVQKGPGAVQTLVNNYGGEQSG